MTWIVHIAHISTYSNPISFWSGDQIKVSVLDDQYPGWMWVTTIDGNQGWAPIQYLELDNVEKTAIALHDYSANELDTTRGESLVMHYELNGWAWVENEKKECGWVPMNTIKKNEV